MVLNEKLAEYFRNAIEFEQTSDTLLTTSYLEAYSPKKLASFGLAVINLVMLNMRSGLGGKTLIELSLDAALSRPEDEIQCGSIRVGDIVKLDRMGEKEQNTALEGVIVKVSGKVLGVSVEEDASDDTLLNLYNKTGNDNIRMWVVKLTNSITYKRMLQAMTRLQELKESDKTEVLRILLGESRYTPRTRSEAKKMQFFDPNLNDSQKAAIDFAVNDSPIAIIHGPPGTGKTYTLIELIKQLTFNHGERVLVCGASNISVDNILERLSVDFGGGAEEAGKKGRRRKATKTGNPEKLIRIGHPARLLPGNLQHSLDVLSKSSYAGEGGDGAEILKDIENDIGTTLGQIKKCKRYGERRALWTELKQLRKELRVREKKIVRDLLRNAQVVLSTLHGAGSNDLFTLAKEYSVDNPLFHTIVIDEVSQSLEPQCWIPLLTHLGFRRLVIAGDNMQLPATVKSREEVLPLIKKGQPIADLEYTLFDRLVEELHGYEYKRLLNVQYRMNQQIMEFPSRELYNGELVAGDAVKHILLCDLAAVESTDETTVPCIWYDTQGGDYPEQTSDDEKRAVMSASAGSKYNDMETAVVLDHVQKLVAAGVQPEMVGVISPYSAQVSLLKKNVASRFANRIEVATIDGFQGREKEVIVVSLVRSNDNREVGFLQDRRRLNVAMTRPKRHLCVVGDMELLGNCGVRFLADWARYAEDQYEVRYPDMTDFQF